MSLEPDPPAWQRKYGSFTHDWLKNSFLNHLGACISLLESQSPAHEFSRFMVRNVLPEWFVRREDACWLVNRFRTDMSPAIFLSRPPLLNCSPAARDWLRRVADVTWEFRFDTGKLELEAQSAISDVDKAHANLTECMAHDTSHLSMRVLLKYKNPILELNQSCIRLSKSLGALPRKVLTV